MSDRAPLPPEGFRTRGPRPSGTRLVLIRHGEAVCNRDGLIGGPRGCGGLTDLGQLQALALRDRLVRTRELSGASALYTSVLPRAQQTAALLAPALRPELLAVADCELCELHPGDLADGLTWTAFVEKFGAPDWDADPTVPLSPGGESWVSFFFRCQRALNALVDRHEGEQVVVVVHGGVIEQALKLVYATAPGARLRLRTENCSVTEVEVRAGAWHLLRYNDRAPLDADVAARFVN